MNQEKHHTIENESFAITATEDSGCRLVLKITVKPTAAKKAYKQAIKVVNKQISIPGFRKGHVPDATVISRHGAAIEQEWKEILLNDAYRAAVKQTQIYPLNKEAIEKPKFESCSQEEGAVIALAYEFYPRVPTIDFSKLSLPHIEKKPVSEEQILDVAEEVRRSHADWEDVEGRGVQEGDHVDVTIEAIDVDPPKPIVQDRRFEVSEKRMALWLKKLLIGLKPGETVEGMSEVDENAEVRIKKNFKPTQIKLTLHSIKKILLPELSDALAQKAGAQSQEDLLEKIRANLEQEAAEELKQSQVVAMEEALVENYPFDLPTSVVEAERNELLKNRLQALRDANLPEEEIKAKEHELEAEVNYEAYRRLRLYFINKQISKQGNISLTNKELNDEVVNQLSSNPYYYGRELDNDTTKQLVSKLASALMQRKTKDYALSQVLAGHHAQKT